MRIVLLTGIYPPEIGGTATYAEALATGLLTLGHEVKVVTYGRSEERQEGQKRQERYEVASVSRVGNVLSRWMRYAKMIRKHATDADMIIALSSVSVGIPLMFAGLKKPKKILRLGGDFFWERATDGGSMLSLRAWYASTWGEWRIINTALMEAILSSFDLLVYSTKFQQEIHEKAFKKLPERVVIENASSTSPIPARPSPQHVPLRLLFLGRFVGFKNLFILLDAVASMPDVTLTLVGSGPLEQKLRAHARCLALESRVLFLPPVTGREKQDIFGEHDLLVIPSVTEISPNVALEAVSAGLPVLLTEETGYRSKMSSLLIIKPLRTSEQIVVAVREVMHYMPVSSQITCLRNWGTVAEEWIAFLTSLS